LDASPLPIPVAICSKQAASSGFPPMKSLSPGKPSFRGSAVFMKTASIFKFACRHVLEIGNNLRFVWNPCLDGWIFGR
jgi:hypothetical protein